jgi:hypothetical protein
VNANFILSNVLIMKNSISFKFEHIKLIFKSHLAVNIFSTVEIDPIRYIYSNNKMVSEMTTLFLVLSGILLCRKNLWMSN